MFGGNPKKTVELESAILREFHGILKAWFTTALDADPVT